MDNFFPTSRPDESIMTDTTPSTLGAMQIEIQTLQSNLESMTNNWHYASSEMRELRQKIDNVRGYIADIYSEDGEIDDRVKEIAGYLDIELTKRISGTATFEISFSAEVPMDFDADDFEISFSAECESYEADNFDWQEENSEVHAEDDE